MRMSDWRSDVCSSDLTPWRSASSQRRPGAGWTTLPLTATTVTPHASADTNQFHIIQPQVVTYSRRSPADRSVWSWCSLACWRSEEHTSELQSLMRISYAVFRLKKKKIKRQ